MRLLRRTSREVLPTAAGERVLARARRVLAEVEDLARETRSGGERLRVGHAWAAVGERTSEFQHRWAEQHPGVTLHLVRTNSPTGGLAEGVCDVNRPGSVGGGVQATSGVEAAGRTSR